MEMKIPKMFMIFGETYKVRQVLKVDSKNSWGEYDPSKNVIRIKKDINKDQQEQTYLHEIVHCALCNLGYDNLNNDEVFVDTFSKALHQILTTGK